MACVNHPDVPEVTRCDGCRRRVCQDCFVVLDGRQLCGSCKSQTVRQVERGGILEVGHRAPSPWEQGRSLESLVETLRAVLGGPSTFYGDLALEAKGYWSYIIAVGWPASVLGTVILLLFPVLAGLTVGASPGLGGAEGLVAVGLTVLLTPLQLVIGVAVQGTVAHLFLRLAGGANARLETSVRASAYAQSPLVLQWIPILGPIVAALWSLGLLIIGLKHMHGTSYARVLTAVLLPFVLCMGLFIFIFGLAFLARPPQP